jgi:hypothetical protein
MSSKNETKLKHVEDAITAINHDILREGRTSRTSTLLEKLTAFRGEEERLLSGEEREIELEQAQPTILLGVDKQSAVGIATIALSIAVTKSHMVQRPRTPLGMSHTAKRPLNPGEPSRPSKRPSNSTQRVGRKIHRGRGDIDCLELAARHGAAVREVKGRAVVEDVLAHPSERSRKMR